MRENKQNFYSACLSVTLHKPVLLLFVNLMTKIFAIFLSYN